MLDINDTIVKRIVVLILCLFFTLVYPEIGTKIADSLSQQYGIAWNYIHHLVQFLLALLTILAFVLFGKRYSISDFGFNQKNRKWSLKTVRNFTIGWIIITVVLNLLFNFGNQIVFEPTTVNVVTSLFFDFVITPLSEETLFRGLIFSVLVFYFPGKLHVGKLSVSYAVLLSTFFFSVAHIGIDYHTFKIVFIDYLQLVFTIGLGLFYAIMLERSKSLLGPMIAHGVSDGVIKSIQLILTCL